MDDKTQTKYAMYGFATLLLLALLIPAALFGNATAPKATPVPLVEPNVSPRTAATVACQAVARARDAGAAWVNADGWLMSKHASGNYSLLMRWVSGGQPTLARCVLQPVNGSLQVVSLS